MPQPHCECEAGGPLVVEPDLDLARRTLTHASIAARPPTLMRYRELLPCLDVGPTLMPIMTPLTSAPRLSAELEVGALIVKDESCQPTGSLKARPSAVAVVRASTFGYDEVACASSGNAGISLAAMAASHGLRATVFVPDRIPRMKLAQLRAYGARVVVVRGSYESAYALCGQACAEFGWYNRNCAQDPYLVEGKKTCGLEIAEQTAEGPPDWVVVPVGDGCTITGVWKGLKEMSTLGFIPRLPRMLGVQAVGAPAVYDAWAEERALTEVEARHPMASTLADSIAVTHPHNGTRAVDSIRESGGAAVIVDDTMITDAVLDLSRSGVLVEPASAATLAGVRAAIAGGDIERNERVLVVGTGSGLKSLDLVSSLLGEPPAPIEPSLDAFVQGLGR
jgi:threonine synthase